MEQIASLMLEIFFPFLGIRSSCEFWKACICHRLCWSERGETLPVYVKLLFTTVK